ncbi:hypothetical protein A9308_06185 [Moraxella atlantae]|uniref:Uncharacterized protein n=1 Tax=Faucicola atlantae TaxID=34059 RepID=A0A1B8QCL2_9GAMM|nr:hypothetical protein A9308_06185 [Moraxella atlantae]
MLLNTILLSVAAWCAIAYWNLGITSSFANVLNCIIIGALLSIAMSAYQWIFDMTFNDDTNKPSKKTSSMRYTLVVDSKRYEVPFLRIVYLPIFKLSKTNLAFS